MKRLFVVALATLTLSSLTIVHAQSTTPAPAPAAQPAAAKAKGEGIDKRVAQLKKELTLTDAQTAQVKDLLTQEHADVLKIKQDSTLTPAAKKEQGSALNKQYHDKINALLTPEQQKIYAASAPAGKPKKTGTN